VTNELTVDSDRDVRAFLGMNTVSAYIAAAVFFTTYSLMNFTSSEGVRSVWVVESAVLLVSAAAFALVAVPGDPLSARWATAIAAAAPISTAVVLPQLPVPVDTGVQTWPLSAAVALCGFVSVRGRTAIGWLAMSAVVAVCIVWSAATGQGPAHGIGMSAINIAPLVMATFFALTFRSTAAAVFELRRQSRRRAAENAATSAALDERDRQLERLDHLARPLLDKLASGAELDPAERRACGLLEAALRDGLRAPGLMTVNIVAAARSARARCGRTRGRPAGTDDRRRRVGARKRRRRYRQNSAARASDNRVDPGQRASRGLPDRTRRRRKGAARHCSVTHPRT
jgi:hypothetical protein